MEMMLCTAKGKFGRPHTSCSEHHLQLETTKFQVLGSLTANDGSSPPAVPPSSLLTEGFGQGEGETFTSKNLNQYA